MRVLFLTRLYYPHVGGVEKHVGRVANRLKLRGNNVTVITEKFDENLKNKETIDEIKVLRFSYPKIKLLGLLYIWLWFSKNIGLIKQSDIVHIHDVFIWYLPFRFLFPKRKVYTTFHGWEGMYPIPWKNIFLRRLAAKLSWGNICVGRYIEKHYGVKSDFITYGATEIPKKIPKKEKRVVYVGRLEKDTGLPIFLKQLAKFKGYRIDFCGDGSLRQECKVFGKVHGFVDPRPFLAKAEVCLPAGYLSALEAMAHKCKIKVAWNNPLKRNYWQMTPFYQFLTNEEVDKAYGWVKKQTWQKLTSEYLELWHLT